MLLFTLLSKPNKRLLAYMSPLIFLIIFGICQVNIKSFSSSNTEPTQTPNPSHSPTPVPTISNNFPTALPSPTIIIPATPTATIQIIEPTKTSTPINTATPIKIPTIGITPISIHTPTATAIPFPTPIPTISQTPQIMIIDTIIDNKPITKNYEAIFGSYILYIISEDPIEVELLFSGGCKRTYLRGSHAISITNPTYCEGPTLLPGEKFSLNIKSNNPYEVKIQRMHDVSLQQLPSSFIQTGFHAYGPFKITNDLEFELIGNAQVFFHSITNPRNSGYLEGIKWTKPIDNYLIYFIAASETSESTMVITK